MKKEKTATVDIKHDGKTVHSEHITLLEPRRSFRWIFRCEGVPEHLVRRVRSLDGGRLEVGLFWPEDGPFDPRPKMHTAGGVASTDPSVVPVAGSAALCLLGRTGEITQTFDITFTGYEVLWFDLDYGSSEPTEPRLVFHGCVATPRNT